MNQIALVDRAIQDIKVSRQRYEGQARVASRINANGEDGESINSGYTAQPDPFDDFRTQKLDPTNLIKVTLETGTYDQVPSRFASVSNMVSVYSVANKSDVPGAAHIGSSVDTRFGNVSKQVILQANRFGTMQQHLKRENARFRLRKYHEQMDMDEIRQSYVPRLGRQKHSTTGLQKTEINRHQRQAVRDNGYGKHQHANSNLQNRNNVKDNVNQHQTSIKNKAELTADGKAKAQLILTDQKEKRILEEVSRLEPPTSSSSATLVGSSSFSTQSGKVEGYPPDIPNINRPLHPGQQYANKLHAERLMRERQLAHGNSRSSEQVHESREHADDQAPGALAARASRIVPRPGNLPDALMPSYQRVENLRSSRVSLYHRGTFTKEIIRGGMAPPSSRLRLPSIEEMLAGGMCAPATIYNGNIGVRHNLGFPGPMTEYPLGGQILFHAPIRAREMLPRACTPTPPPLRSSLSLQEITNMQNRFGNLGVEDSFGDQAMVTPQYKFGGGSITDLRKRNRRDQRSNRIALSRFSQRANSEYARFMDEMNAESRSRRDEFLAGDMLSGHAQALITLSIQPPSPSSKTHENGEDELDDEEDNEMVKPEEQVAWSDLMTSPDSKLPAHRHHPAIFDTATASSNVPLRRSPHLLSATRPPTQSPRLSILQDGRKSVPPRSRPALLSPIDMLQHRNRSRSPMDIAAIRERLTAQSYLIFGEKPGSVSSREPSPAGKWKQSVSGRRLYEK
jgi:hypothetical protein